MSRKQSRVLTLGLSALVFGALAVMASLAEFRRQPVVPTIAFIPQSAGTLLWDVEHAGANAAAESQKVHLYWNAPTSENDVAGQGSLIDKVSGGGYQGLVLAPIHPRAILASLHRALEVGFPVVIISSAMDLPANVHLTYILNDDEKMGEIAAAEMARLIHGKGPVAFVGVSRYAPGIMRRALGAERFLSTHFPGIQIVGRFGGAFSISRSEEFTTEAVESNPGLKAILSFTAISTRGVHSILRSRSLRNAVRLVGCEQDSDLIGDLASGEIAAIAGEDTYRMGYEAVQIISAALAAESTGKSLPPPSVIPPLLITKDNFNSPEITRLMTHAR